MATLTASAAQATSPAKYIENGMVVRSCKYTFAAAQSAGDVVQMVKIPSGAHIHEVLMNYAGLGGASLTTTVGDGNSASRYYTSFSTNTSTILVRNLAGYDYSYSAEDTIDVVIGSVGSASIGTTIAMTVYYSMDQAQDGNS